MTTTIDPTRLLCSLLGYAGHEVLAHQFALDEDLAPFIDAGWLSPVANFAAVLCEVCDIAHLCELVGLDGQPQALCMRTGEEFKLGQTTQPYRVEGLAVARSLASALQLDGDARTVRRIANLWTLGTRTLGERRVKFFLTPDFDRLDTATSIVDAAAEQSRTMKSTLIVANDRLDHIRLLAQHITVITLRDIAKVDAAAQFSIDEALLLSIVVPEAARARGQGRRPEQRDRILPILNELGGGGLTLDTSNKTCRVVAQRFEYRYPAVPLPSKSTIVSAIECWLGRSK